MRLDIIRQRAHFIEVFKIAGIWGGEGARELLRTQGIGLVMNNGGRKDHSHKLFIKYTGRDWRCMNKYMFNDN